MGADDRESSRLSMEQPPLSRSLPPPIRTLVPTVLRGNELTDSPEIVYGDCHTTLKGVDGASRADHAWIAHATDSRCEPIPARSASFDVALLCGKRSSRVVPPPTPALPHKWGGSQNNALPPCGGGLGWGAFWPRAEDSPQSSATSKSASEGSFGTCRIPRWRFGLVKNRSFKH